ncbi:PRSR2 protein, partial [Atractosteus spatula]|nr:PRSR2 protein [Atractosteus spatula]
MPRGHSDPSSLSMDLHLSSAPRLHYGINGNLNNIQRHSLSRNSHLEDDALQHLSQEEKECILFFEETIDSLDEEPEDPNLSSGSSTPVEDSPTPEDRSPVLKEPDIIDLVQKNSQPPVLREPVYQPHVTGTGIAFTLLNTSFSTTPESHFEIKPKRELMKSYSSEFVFPPLPPPVADHETDSPHYPPYHPVGSIPTPVLIAQKIAESQRGSGPLSPTPLPSERRSLEPEKSPPPSPDYPGKPGPATGRKPSRYPGNINVTNSTKDYNQTIAKAAVKVQERKAQVLANLTGGPLSPDIDPAPEQSRLEALSKLGLTKEHAPTGPSVGKPKVALPTSVSPGKAEAFSTDCHNVSNPKAAAVPCSSSPKPVVTSRPDPRNLDIRVSPISRHSGAHSFQVTNTASLEPRAPLSPELRRARSSTKSAFRPQGITVQFSGRGATDESRREALRKLGLLKNTS